MIVIEIHQEPDPETARRLDWLVQAVSQLIGDVETMALDFAALEAAAAAETDAIAAIEAFIASIAQSVKDDSANQQRVNALADKLLANKARLAAAIVTGTPADPAVPTAG